MPPIRHRLLLRPALALAAILLLWSGLAPAQEEPEESFESKLARVEEALRKNPNHVLPAALDSCLRQRNHAIRLYEILQMKRANRSLDYCIQMLKISRTRPRVTQGEKVDLAAIQAQAESERKAALALEPDLDNGLEIFRECARCHTPEGRGLANVVPQIAGQHRSVVIKQLADIRAGNREVLHMGPYAEAIDGPQEVADVAGYIDTLEISTENDRGPGDQLALGEKLYRENCVSCHGAQGEGNAETFAPRIQSQHYEYLVWQIEQIQKGDRRNAHPGMQALVADFSEAQIHAVADYVSRLQPPEELQAPPGWRNPDFAAR